MKLWVPVIWFAVFGSTSSWKLHATCSQGLSVFNTLEGIYVPGILQTTGATLGSVFLFKATAMEGHTGHGVTVKCYIELGDLSWIGEEESGVGGLGRVSGQVTRPSLVYPRLLRPGVPDQTLPH